MPRGATPTIHRVTPTWALEGVLTPHPGGRPRVERIADIHPAAVAIAPIAFGHRDLSGRTIAEHPAGGAWRATEYQAHGRTILLLRDATVRSQTGIVTMDGHVVAETLIHIPDHALGGERAGDGIAFRPNGAVHHMAQATHLLGGSYDNYYHWMTDIVVKLPFADAFGAGSTPLFGAFQRPFQPATLALLRPSEMPRRGLADHASVDVDELLYIPALSGAGFEPHPCMLAAFDLLCAGAGGGGPARRRLYVSRRGSERRPLLNEAEIIAMLEGKGFTTVQLDDMELRDQILLFAEASHIVAPHGAGLTNLLFCKPGTTVLELLPDNYVNWCFRRAASLRHLRYGCLVGEVVGPWNTGWPHANGWMAPLDELGALLRSEVFA